MKVEELNLTGGCSFIGGKAMGTAKKRESFMRDLMGVMVKHKIVKIDVALTPAKITSVDKK